MTRCRDADISYQTFSMFDISAWETLAEFERKNIEGDLEFLKKRSNHGVVIFLWSFTVLWQLYNTDKVEIMRKTTDFALY